MRKITKEYVKGMLENNELTVISPPKVPEYVAKWFEENKGDLEYSIWEYLYYFREHEVDSTDFFNFMNSADTNPIGTLILMQYGYYVEKEVERLYVVKLPQEVGCLNHFLTKLKGKVDITCSFGYTGQPEYHLTEAEIRGIWDGYMELAKEVE
ncbi:DUF1642 domain-containing protein [Listeria seeligeri]|uniref:DUF1642 domain-containing protein n=1 Tax=Listeria seeligeri TaxID=1640 RepID=UPI00164DE40C|nr:DUF1642 domain-containing protein [Listeria seeligeri]MBC6123109.1 DUF1642 domain-containing protein [Listeria seeligeri]